MRAPNSLIEYVLWFIVALVALIVALKLGTALIEKL